MPRKEIITIALGQKRGFNKYKVCGDYTIIYLEKRTGEILETIIDTEDLEKLTKQDFSWNAAFDPKMNQYYAQATEYLRGKNKTKTKQLAREILNAKEGEYVDHKDHDILNNRKYNLRISKGAENTKNRKGKNSNNKSGYRNVFWNKRKNKWEVHLQVNGKDKCFGRFNNVHEAGEYAKIRRQEIYGEFAGYD